MTAQCKVCNTQELKRFLALGDLPPVNAFLDKHELAREKAYPLNLAYCPECLLVQLENIVPPEELFSNYLHLSSGSASNVAHLREVTDLLKQRFSINKETRVLEIGSNDATLLSFIKESTPHVLGIDPAKNLIPLSEQKGIETLPLFFNAQTAEELFKTRGTFDIIVALNVIPHTPNVIDLLKGVARILAPQGTLVMEGVYALETILRGEFDTVYHEHVYTFSLHSLIATFKRAGLCIVDVEKIPQQGGSLRLYAQHESEAAESSPAVHALLREEEERGLINRTTYDALVSKVENYKKEFRAIIDQEKAAANKLIGIGAPARGVVILNCCGLTQDDLAYIVDDTPLKQGKLAPGVHIPVKSWDTLAAERYKNPAFVLLSWNYRDYLLQRLKAQFPDSKVIIPFPKLEVVSLD